MRFTVASFAFALLAGTAVADLSRKQVPAAKRHARQQRRIAANDVQQRSTASELLSGLGEIFSGDGTYFTPGEWARACSPCPHNFAPLAPVPTDIRASAPPP